MDKNNESLLPSFGLLSGPAIKRFRSEFDSLLEDFFGNDRGLEVAKFEGLQPKSSFPKVNVSETDEAYNVEIAIAGFDKDDVNLELKDKDLIISAEKKESDGEGSPRYLSQEISYRAFKRVIRFPQSINNETVSAEYKNGIIYFKVLKKELKTEKSITIDIK